MPNPAVIVGADVSLGLQKFAWALYLSTTGVLPIAKVGSGFEPAAPWVRCGRLKGDEFTWNISAPQMLEGRAGFSNVLKFYVVKQAELPQLTVPMDESDPEMLSRLRGNAAGSATSLSSGSYTGYSFSYVAGTVLNTRALLIGTEVNGLFERQVYAGNAFVTFKFVTNPDSEGVEAMITMANDANNQAFAVQNWK